MQQEKTQKTTKTIFYPASYLVMTVTSLLLLVAVSGLGALIIHYWINGVSNLLNDTFILYWIASLAVVVPIHLLAYHQVRSTATQQVTLFSMRFAHGLLGAYLFITVGSIITLGTWLVAVWLNTILGTGEFDKQLLATSLSLLQTIGWLVYATQHFLRSRGNASRPKYYILIVSILSILVLILGLVFPAVAYQNVARDFVKENNVSQINQAIGEYVDEHNDLPSNLNALSDLSDTTKHHLGDYEYSSQGNTKFGIFGYTLCATFARSNDKGYDTGFGFSSHASGKQCFTRTTISFTQFNQDLSKYIKGDVTKFNVAVQSFLLTAKKTVDQEVSGIEGFAGGQVKQLEGNLEGLEGGTTELQAEMERLEGNLNGLEGDTGDLAGDFASVEKFLHDLGCLFGECKS